MKYATMEWGTMEAVVNKLGGLDGVQKFLRGELEIVTIRHVIDCTASPFVPGGWNVKSHQNGGKLEWDLTKIKLYLSDGQKDGKYVVGTELQKELEDQLVLNANVLDYLLKHPELIPEDWKGKYVFFWGTVYRDSDGCLYVRYLYWYSDSWIWDCRWLGYDFYSRNPAVVVGK